MDVAVRPNQQYVKSWGFSRRLLTVFTAFDISKTQNIAFLHTIGGTHSGNQQSWRRTGYCGLGTAVEKLGVRTSESLSIDFTTSSLGSFNIGFLSALYLATQGDDGLTEYECRSSSARTAKRPETFRQSRTISSAKSTRNFISITPHMRLLRVR